MTGGQVDTMADAGLDVGGGRDYYNTPGASSWSGHQRCHRQCHQHHLYTFIIIKCGQVNPGRVNDRQTTSLIWCAYLQLDSCFMIYFNLLRDGWVLKLIIIELISQQMRIQILREYCSDIRAAVFFTRWKTSSANFFAQSKTADDNLIMSNDNW